MRRFRTFSYRDANYRVSVCGFNTAVKEIKALRNTLEKFISRNTEFRTSLKPVDNLNGEIPEIASVMLEASRITGTGPMAAVAGSFAQAAAEAVITSGCPEAVVENGGDIFLVLEGELILGIYTGTDTVGSSLAFRISKEMSPLAVCSSSGRMGHSRSLGNCDIVTVFSKSGALADAAATLACNMIKTENDIQSTVDHILKLKGISGIFAVKNDKIGIGGEVPELIKNSDPDIAGKVTKDLKSSFPG